MSHTVRGVRRARRQAFAKVAFSIGVGLVADAAAVAVAGVAPSITMQVKKLTAADADPGDQFGQSVAISGGTIVVGAHQEDGAGSASGSAYVFARNQAGADNWGLLRKLTASAAAAGDEFGFSVAIDGDMAVVGAPGSDGGAAYVFERNFGGADNWGQVKELTGSDTSFGNRFGEAVAISEETVVVTSGNGPYVFARNRGGADNWGEVKKLTASDAGPLGDAVSISGDTIVVGAPEDNDAGPMAGSVYVFRRNQGGANNWGQVKKLTASDAGSLDHFGIAVSISGAMVVVGAPGNNDDGTDSGSAYVFARDQGGGENWGQVRELHASDASTGDQFGASVSISGDRVVVGAHMNSDAGSESGSAYVFARNLGGADNWSEVTKLIASDAAAGDRFGGTVATDGGTVVAGAGLDDVVGANSGSSYVFTLAECQWTEVAKTGAGDAAAGDLLGSSVSISGDTVVVGAAGNDDMGSASGSAYVLARNQGSADNWGQVKKLTALDGAAGDAFGYSVSISGDKIVVGTPFKTIGAEGWRPGAAYVFGLLNHNWPEERKLIAADAESDDQFGASVSISGDTVVVGAPFDDHADSNSGSAYVFARNQFGAGLWGQVRKLTAPDGAAGDEFGHSVSISGDTVVVGAAGNDAAGPDSGSVYLFARNQGGADQWGFVKKLTASDGAAGDAFGHSASISGDTLVVGADEDDDAGAASGSAYVLERNQGGANNWGQVKKLTASDAAVSDRFGDAVTISGDTIVVGAYPNDDAGSDSGSAYVFARNQGGANNWGEVTKLTASDAAAGDRFGRSVSISGKTAVAGAELDDDAGSESGSAYVFDVNCSATPGEASPARDMRAARSGSSIAVTFTPACGADDHAAYIGLGPIVGGVQWQASHCGLGVGGTASFDPGSIPPGQLLYFVIVGFESTGEGSYGTQSGGAVRPEAVGIGSCDRPMGVSNCP